MTNTNMEEFSKLFFERMQINEDMSKEIEYLNNIIYDNVVENVVDIRDNFRKILKDNFHINVLNADFCLQFNKNEFIKLKCNNKLNQMYKHLEETMDKKYNLFTKDSLTFLIKNNLLNLVFCYDIKMQKFLNTDDKIIFTLNYVVNKNNLKKHLNNFHDLEDDFLQTVQYKLALSRFIIEKISLIPDYCFESTQKTVILKKNLKDLTQEEKENLKFKIKKLIEKFNVAFDYLKKL